MNECCDILMDRVLLLFMRITTENLSDIKSRLTIIFSDYKIEPKETAIAVYTQGKNEIFMQRFLLAKATAGCQERTLVQYKREISRALRKIGKDADQVTTADIQLLLAHLMAKGDSKSYCDNVRRYLNTFYSFLQRENIITVNPMNRVEKIKFHREKETAFNDMEIELMRSACETAFEKAVLEVALSTGCRAAELCSIKIDDINNDQISILGKGGKYSTVYLNAKSQLAIRAYMDERKDAGLYLFPAGKPFGQAEGMRKIKGNWYRHPELVESDKPYGSVNALLKKIGKRAGVSNVHAHRFRRTCATHALRRGMPIEIVSMMLGHEQLSTTQIYLDIREDDLREAHRKYVT